MKIVATLTNDRTGISVQVCEMPGGFSVDVKGPMDKDYIIYRRYVDREKALEVAKDVVRRTEGSWQY